VVIIELPKSEYLAKKRAGGPEHQREVFDGGFQKNAIKIYIHSEDINEVS